MCVVNSGHGREDVVLKLFHLIDDIPDDSLLSCCSEKCIEIYHTNATDVDRSSFFVMLVKTVRKGRLEGSLFRKLPCVHQILNVFISVPLGKVLDHCLDLGFIELSGSTEPQDVSLIEMHLF